jgi:pimeloyl-ACP methyl ester carboxylesterase
VGEEEDGHRVIQVTKRLARWTASSSVLPVVKPVMSAAAPALPTSDPAPASLDLPEGPLSYVDEGPRDAPAVVAVHGIPGSVRDFRYLAPQLTDRVRFVRVDMPGFGGSAPVRDAIESLAGRARVVLALADRLGLRRFAILGHSMGGGTALVLASDHASRVSHVVLLASVALSLHRGLGMSPRVFGWLSRGATAPLIGSVLLPLMRAQYRSRRFPGADQMGPAAFAVHFRAFAALDFVRLRRAVEGPLPPTLLAYARDDHMVETWVSEELARAMPRARVVAFEEGGHNIQKTRAVELGQAIKEMILAGV